VIAIATSVRSAFRARLAALQYAFRFRENPMSFLVSIAFESARALLRRPLLFVAAGALFLSPLACASRAKDVSIDIGGGVRKGTPPMCYQHRSEVRSTTSAYDIWLHLNNTCSYAVNCTFFDDVTEKEYQFNMLAFANYSHLIADDVETKRVDLDVECTWKP